MKQQLRRSCAKTERVWKTTTKQKRKDETSVAQEQDYARIVQEHNESQRKRTERKEKKKRT